MLLHSVVAQINSVCAYDVAMILRSNRYHIDRWVSNMLQQRIPGNGLYDKCVSCPAPLCLAGSIGTQAL